MKPQSSSLTSGAQQRKAKEIESTVNSLESFGHRIRAENGSYLHLRESEKTLHLYMMREPGINLQMMKKIEIICINNDVTKTTRVCKCLTKQRFLQTLTLDLNGLYNKATDKEIIDIGRSLQSLTFLHTLNFTLRRCDGMTDRGLRDLSRGLQSLTSLQSLNLDLERCQNITDTGLKYLSRGLRSLTFLQSLNLILAWCFEITDQGLSDLIDGVQSLTFLQSLNLNLSGFDITDVGLKDLSRGLQSLTLLKSLTLDFGGCERITDAVLTDFTGGLRCLTPLQSLSLNLAWCNQITDSVLTDLQFPASLQSLSLLLPESNVTKRALKTFIKNLQTLQPWKFLEISLC